MKVSIITATYNSAETIQDTLTCIQNQTYPNIEHIIVDGNSTDETLQIIRANGNRVSKLISEPDSGLYDAMNKGIAMATGDIVGILNSDDFYQHDRVIERVVQTLQQEGTDTVYGDLQYVDAENTNKVIRYWKAGPFKRRRFRFGWMLPHPTFFVRRELYDQYGAFNLDLRIAADYELMIRMLYSNKVSASYIPEVLVRMRTGGNSNASFRQRMRANREDREAWNVNGGQPYPWTTMMKPLRKLPQYLLLNTPPAPQTEGREGWVY
jgi:glycosyltransferase involved in cell wall biosynthesis